MKQKFQLFVIIIFSIAATAAATAAYTAPAQPQTRVETDEKTGAVLFVVKGREEARIDGAGLHVRRSVDYGGASIDAGEAGYDDRQARASRAE